MTNRTKEDGREMEEGSRARGRDWRGVSNDEQQAIHEQGKSTCHVLFMHGEQAERKEEEQEVERMRQGKGGSGGSDCPENKSEAVWMHSMPFSYHTFLSRSTLSLYLFSFLSSSFPPFHPFPPALFPSFSLPSALPAYPRSHPL